MDLEKKKQLIEKSLDLITTFKEIDNLVKTLNDGDINFFNYGGARSDFMKSISELKDIFNIK